jgi:hypothetical protein
MNKFEIIRNETNVIVGKMDYTDFTLNLIDGKVVDGIFSTMLFVVKPNGTIQRKGRGLWGSYHTNRLDFLIRYFNGGK